MNSQHLSATAYCIMYTKKIGRVYNISKNYWANKKYLGTLHSDSLYNEFKAIFLIKNINFKTHIGHKICNPATNILERRNAPLAKLRRTNLYKK